MPHAQTTADIFCLVLVLHLFFEARDNEGPLALDTDAQRRGWARIALCLV